MSGTASNSTLFKSACSAPLGAHTAKATVESLITASHRQPNSNSISDHDKKTFSQGILGQRKLNRGQNMQKWCLQVHCLLSEKKISDLFGPQLLWLKWLLGEPAFHCSQLQAASLSWCRHCVCKASRPPLCLFFHLSIHLLKSPPGRQVHSPQFLLWAHCSSTTTGQGHVPEGEQEAKPPAVQADRLLGEEAGWQRKDDLLAQAKPI